MDPAFVDGWLSTAADAVAGVNAFAAASPEGSWPDGPPGVWMGETGGSYNSGHNDTSNAFINAFWYLESLAGFARSGHKGFCRQTLVGGNYELVDK